MKINPAVLALLILSAIPAFAQGTFSFRVVLDGAHAVPPNSSTRQSLEGEFTINSSMLFSGGVGLIDYSDVTTVSLFRSTSAAELGTRLYDFTPGLIVAPGPNGEPGFQGFDLSRTLTPSEAIDLQSGLWWVNVITPGFPNGEIRGQITAVPEPGTYALMTMGAAALLLTRRTRKGQR